MQLAQGNQGCGLRSSGYQYGVRLALLLILNLVRLVAVAQSPTPFSCSTGLAYLLTNPTTNANGNVTSLYSFDLSSGSALLIKDGVLPEPYRFLNAFGYNVRDNFLYGYRYTTNQVVKVGSNGDVQSFSVTGLSTSGSYATGDVSPNGVLYLFGSGSTVVSVNLNSGATDYMTARTRLTGPAGGTVLSGLNDWAVSPINGKIYGMTGSKVLVSYDTLTSVATRIGTVSGLDGQSSSFGTAFMDNGGNLYVGKTPAATYTGLPRPTCSPLPARLPPSCFPVAWPGKIPAMGPGAPVRL